MPAEQVEGTNKSQANIDRRLGVYRESNASLESETHIQNFFTKLIGEENCMLLDNPDETRDEGKTLQRMRQKLEQNGKPCCLNLITDADNKFLNNIERMARREAREAEAAAKGSQMDSRS